MARLTENELLVLQEDDYELITFKIHPKISAWAKEESQKKGINYQIVINEFLLEKIS
jgi:hypothetical protein